ncbi:NPR1/NH1-interacting protein - like 3 [Theobroma cacao]|nr:NPR1/NH1-interacting protein - like 3 [Theobroma cacao]
MEGKTKETPALVNDDDDEQEKINTFSTLVRNLQDAHSRMLIGSQDRKGKEKGKEKENKSTWTPSFNGEDFAEDHALLTNISVTLPSSSKTQEQKCKTEEHEE